MLLVLAVYYLPKCGVQALAIPPANASVPLPSCDDLRTVWDITWSCLVTIFACNWAAIHPNIPSPDDKWFQITLRRAGITFMSLIAPELLSLWALRQRLAARRLANKYNDSEFLNTKLSDLPTTCAYASGFEPLSREGQLGFVVTTSAVNLENAVNFENTIFKETVQSPSSDASEFDFLDQCKKVEFSIGDDCKPNCKWTLTHGFFVLMGGFMLYDGDTPIRTLDPGEFERLVENKIIEVPRITEEEIQDRSKGDMLSKALVLVQTGWFVLQCLARAVKRLPVTELEIITLAFALVNLITYVLWWNKPQDVNSPHRVQMISYEIQPETPGEDFSARQLARHGDWHEFWSHTFRKTIGNFAYMGGKNKNIAPGAKRVPTFYAADNGMDNLDILVYSGMAISTTFGAVHCMAWSFQFPSYTEQLLWRLFSLAILCLPVVFWATMTLGGFMVEHNAPDIFVCILKGAALLEALPYIVSRIGLLILALASLRSLHPKHFRPFLGPHLSRMSST